MHPRATLLLLALLLPLPASGQDAGALRDSLSAIGDAAALRAAIPRALPASAGAAHLRAGFIELRLHELTGARERAKRARGHFDRARKAEPASAWAHYGWALAMLPEIDRPVGARTIVTLHAFEQDLGIDPRSRARRALERAVRLDPTLGEAAALLARLAEETEDEEAAKQARGALEMQFAATGDAALGLGLARAAGAMGDHEAAAAAARRAALRDPDSAAEAHRMAALALMKVPGRWPDAVREYFAGVGTWDDAVARRYFRDIQLIATEREVSEWRMRDLRERRVWLREFWELRAALAGTSLEERIAEHHHRIGFAETHLRRRTRFGAPPMNSLTYELLDDRFDDRGVIYVRHGAPREVIRSVVGPTRDHVESWIYRDETGEPVMHNFRRYDSQGYDTFVLMYDLPCGPEFVDPRLQYAPELFRVRFRCNRADQAMVSSRFRQSTLAALRSDSHQPAFASDLPFHYETFTFLGGADRTDIVTAIGVAAERLQARRLPTGGTEYALDLAVTLVDTATRTFAQRDTVVRLVTPGALGAGELLQAHLSASLPPGALVHRTRLRDGYQATRGMTYGGPLEVPDYATGEPAMSDVVLATSDSTGGFRRGDVALTLLPSARHRDGNFRVFYELYGIAPGGRYTTEVTVERTGGGISRLFRRNTQLRLRFDEIAPDEVRVIQHVRDVATDLKSGEYRLQVRVRDAATGKTLERERRFVIAG